MEYPLSGVRTPQRGSRWLDIEAQWPTCRSRTEATSLRASSPLHLRCGAFRLFARGTVSTSEALRRAACDFLLFCARPEWAVARLPPAQGATALAPRMSLRAVSPDRALARGES